MITQEQLKELQQRKDDLKRYLDVDGKKIEVEEEELRTHVPDFWQDQKAAYRGPEPMIEKALEIMEKLVKKEG